MKKISKVEQDILDRYKKGDSAMKIASKLFLPISVVEKHINLFEEKGKKSQEIVNDKNKRSHLP